MFLYNYQYIVLFYCTCCKEKCTIKFYIYRVIQKPPYMGKLVSLFTQHALYGHHYVDSKYGRVSPIQGELALTHLLLRAHTSLVPSFRWAISCIFTWHTMAFKCPTSKNQVGWGLETSKATPLDHDDQSNYLKIAYLTNWEGRYRVIPMYGDFRITLYISM
jgi:hypothetical protein